MGRVLLTHALPEGALDSILEAGHEVILASPSGVDLLSMAPDADAIVCLLTDRVDADVLRAGAAGRLRVVSVAAVGYDNVDVDSARFDVPEPLRAVGAALGADPMHFILTGGDDHALVATFPPEVVLPEEWLPIGRVLERAAGEEGGAGAEGGEPLLVTVDGAAYEGPTGHQHFR